MSRLDRGPSRILITALIAATGAALAGCETLSEPTTATSCPANAAMLSVGDGYLETLCGCAEASPVYTTHGQRLTCTITAGTTVFFHFLATTQQHQVVSTGTPSFPSSPLSDPVDPETMVRVHVIRLDTPGTYSFQDQFDPTLQGDLIVL